MNERHPEQGRAESGPKRQPSRLKVFFRLLGGLILTCLLAGLIGLIALQTGPGRRLVVQALADVLARDLGWRLDVGTASGLWPFQLDLADLRLADQDGQWLYIPEARISLRYPLTVVAKFREIKLNRPPMILPSGPPARPLAFLDRSWIIPLPFLAQVEVDSLLLDQAVAGQPLNLRVRTELGNSPGTMDLRAGCESLDGPAARLDLRAGLKAWPRSASLRLTLDEAPGGLASGLLGLSGQAPLSVVLDGAGPLSNWQASLVASQGGQDILNAGLNLSLGASSAENAGFGLQARIRPKAWAFSPELCSALGEQPEMSFKGRFTCAGLPGPQWQIQADELTLTAAAGQASAQGDLGLYGLAPKLSFTARLADPAILGLAMGPLAAQGEIQADVDPAGPVSAKVQAQANDLGKTLAPLGIGLAGLGRLRADLSGDMAKNDWSLDLEGGLAGITPGQGNEWEKIAQALGSEVGIKAKAHLDPTGTLSLLQSQIAAKDLSAKAQGTLFLQSRDIDLTLDFRLTDLADYSPLAGKDLGGSLTASSHVAGNISALDLSLKVQAVRPAYGALRFESASLETEAAFKPEGSAGKLSAGAVRPGGRLALDTRFLMSRDKLGLSGLKLSGPGLDASGDLAVDLRTESASGRLKAGLDLNRLGGFLQVAMAGTGQIEASLGQSQGRQDLTMTAQAKGLKGFDLEVAKVDLSGSLRDVFRAPQGKLAMSASGGRYDSIGLQSLNFQVSGNGKELAFSTLAAATLPEPLRLRSSGAFAPAPGGGNLRLNEFQARAYGTNLILTRPSGMTFSSQGFTMGQTALSLGQGDIIVGGDWRKAGINLRAEAKNLPLDILAKASIANVSGLAAGQVLVSGPPGNPKVRAKAEFAQVHYAAGQGQELPMAEISADLDYSGENLTAGITLTAGEGLHMQGRASVPARFSLKPMDLSLPDRPGLEASLRGTADLALVAAFSGQQDIIAQGAFTADLTAKGRIAAPEINGQAGIDKGYFENDVSGTVLRDIALRAEASGSRIVVQDFSASDGSGGTLSGQGQVEITAGKPSVTGNINMNKAALARTDMLSAIISGNLTVSGDASGLLVKGNLAVGPVNVNIPDRLPPDVVPVQIEEVNAPATKAPAAVEPSVPVRLDIGLDFPQRIFARGLGLDSVWNGRLHVGGLVLSPSVAGDINLVRGQVDFFGRDFNLVKGVVSFTGDSPPTPRLDVDAQMQRSDITADILITGTADQPKVAFTSVPPLPRNEILSQVIFGQSVSGLTAPQALQLAQAAGTFLGAGNALDLLGKTRKLVGLDYLGVGTKGKAGQASLAAGKYVTDKVYVETSQGLGAQSGTVSVEVDLTPHITLDGTVGTDAKTSAGVNWKLDY